MAGQMRLVFAKVLVATSAASAWLEEGGSVCEAYAPCFPNRAKLPPHSSGRFRLPRQNELHLAMTRLAARVRHRLASEQVPVLLHIGPNELSRQEAHTYRRILAEARGQARLIFVEPLPRVARLLRRRMRYATGSNESGEIVQAAVCPSERQHQEPQLQGHDGPILYTFSQQLLDDFPGVPREMFGDLSTLSLKQLLESIPRFQQDRQLPQMTSEEWLKSPYIERLPIRCVSPALLLAELKLHPSAVDMLVTDTEGYDTWLLPEFLDQPGFSPAFLQFEYVNQQAPENASFAVIQRLAKSGYDVIVSFLDVIASRS